MFKKRINFIPRDLQPKLEFPFELIPVVLCSLVLIYVSSTVLKMNFETKRTTQAVETMKVENESLEREIVVLSEQSKRADRNNEAFVTLQKVLSRKNYWSEIFKELSILIPEGIWLTNFTNSTQERLILKGESSSAEGVAKFLRKLEGSQHFSGARMNFSEKEPDVAPTRYKFELSVPVKMPESGGGT
jgi:Tfp pilus assembly protein PilN